MLAVGRLEKNKNIGVILDAISIIKNKKVKLVICGDGKDYIKLKKKAENLGINDRVVFLGNRNDMINVYHSADCYVLSSFREGLSRSLMEAMACGLPCVVTNIRGNRDLIDSQGGFVFRPPDKQKLATSIMKINESSELRKSMSNHNLEKIKAFSLKTVTNKLAEIYKEQFCTEITK